MTREREVKLDVPAAFTLPALELAGVSFERPLERRLRTVYWDTGDLRLIRWGCALRYREGDEGAWPGARGTWTVKLPTTGVGALQVRDEHSFEGGPGRVPAAAGDLLTAYLRGASPAPVARLRALRRALSLRDGGGRPLAEIDDDEVVVQDGRRVAGRFREVEVEITEDCPPELLEAIVNRLRAAGARDPEAASKVIRALGERATAPAEVVVEPLDGAASAGAVVRRAIATSVTRLIRHDAGVRLGGDPEDVHQARVATRRLRSDLRTFGSLVEAGWADELRRGLRELADDLGTVRDGEVLLGRLRQTAGRLPGPDAKAGAALAATLEPELAEARRRLLGEMRAATYSELLERLVAAAQSPRLTAEAETDARDVLPALIAVPWSRLRRDALRLHEESPDAELHALRIRAKRCRYAAEAAAPVSPPAVADFARAVARLQEVLGEHQDAVVAQAWLRDRGSSSRHAFAAGQLWALERQAAEAARQAWPAVWKSAAKRARRLRLR